jgi:hypothetical protein
MPFIPKAPASCSHLDLAVVERVLAEGDAGARARARTRTRTEALARARRCRAGVAEVAWSPSAAAFGGSPVRAIYADAGVRALGPAVISLGPQVISDMFEAQEGGAGETCAINHLNDGSCRAL